MFVTRESSTRKIFNFTIIHCNFSQVRLLAAEGEPSRAMYSHIQDSFMGFLIPPVPCVVSESSVVLSHWSILPSAPSSSFRGVFLCNVRRSSFQCNSRNFYAPFDPLLLSMGCLRPSECFPFSCWCSVPLKISSEGFSSHRICENNTHSLIPKASTLVVHKWCLIVKLSRLVSPKLLTYSGRTWFEFLVINFSPGRIHRGLLQSPSI